ncbi:transcriptional regulator [Nocardia uniformis]|uniref:Transcriptional regulator n=1 Tax=Nocardia uniformis TaxID=53432 RepID=A0A849C4N7_9NOCA|nr:helix-turn-helix domain-containing protein [Nocardia uniformis]NNH71305.1 transcriptional regulator [Nocardia uniformis]
MSTVARGSPWVAVRPEDDVRQLARRVSVAHSSFVEGVDRLPMVRPGEHSVRSVVLDSWQRSRSNGVDPDGFGGAVDLDGQELQRYRASHPTALIQPVVRKLLVEDAADAGLLVAISDARGRLLWVEGDARVKDRAVAMNFVEGADWSEDRVGTNAPGTALALDHHVQIFGAEHFSRAVHEFSCTAAPVHDPISGRTIGAIDITGGPRVAAPEVLSLIRATVLAAESELRLHLLSSPTRLEPATARLQVLGSGRPILIRGEERIRLSQRHAEILLLLADHPEGLSSDHLAMLLDESELDPVTVRAEMSRVRKILGADGLGSRPYRVLMDLETDVGEVRRALARGDAAAALRAYPGPILPRSLAPGIGELRSELHGRLRATLLAVGDRRLLARWTSSVDGRDDVSAWSAYLASLDRNSSTYAQVEAQLALLDHKLGI